MAVTKTMVNLKSILALIPPLTQQDYKGLSGRIGVIGGSVEYTGAPYFAAISALKVGCDLSHVFCPKDAATVIKSYSPELIVHPVLDQPNGARDIIKALPRLHSLVIGPGLGRDEGIFQNLLEVIVEAKKLQIPTVFDADAIYHLCSCLGLTRGNLNVILTPNRVEFNRLTTTAGLEEGLDDKQKVLELAKLLGNTVVLKGERDLISDGVNLISCEEEGSWRRCGGQGDLLCGSLATFNFWSRLRVDELKITHPEVSINLIAAFAACSLTRKCSKMAFNEHGRGMTTTDMIKMIPRAFSELFET